MPLGAAAAIALPLGGCSGPSAGEGRVAMTRSSIAYGMIDTRHTAVVALLSPVGTSQVQECTGNIVALAGGQGYVLTAAHCCNMYPPTIVVASNDFSVGVPYLSGGVPTAPVYAVVPGSVYFDASYDHAGGHDFCMLTFAGAGSGLVTLALPTSANDGLQIGTQVEHVGYGITDTSNTNTLRRTGADAVDLGLTPLLLEFSQGGASHVPGTCDGDSGGPSLVPAGAPQSQQTVVGIQSFGNASSCAQETLGGASRVSSAIGYRSVHHELSRRSSDRRPRRRRLARSGGPSLDVRRSWRRPGRRGFPRVSAGELEGISASPRTRRVPDY